LYVCILLVNCQFMILVLKSLIRMGSKKTGSSSSSSSSSVAFDVSWSGGVPHFHIHSVIDLTSDKNSRGKKAG
jgi:hypothetical protein